MRFCSSVFIPLAVFFLLVILELFSILFPFLGKIASIIWIFAFFIVFFESIIALFNLLKELKNGSAIITTLTLITFISVIIYQAFNVINSNSETTQEISCMLNHLALPDMGYRNTCLFGYPDRQFLFPSLPSIIFGRSVFSLNLGGAIYFICGLILFTSGLRHFLQGNKHVDTLVAIAISTIFHFYYVNWFLFAYEQSIYPLSFSLGITGLFLRFTQKNHYKNLGMIGIMTAFLIFTYTTGLAFMFLTILGLIYIAIFFSRNKLQKKIILFVTLCLSFLFISSLLFRHDINVFAHNNEKVYLLRDTIEGLKGIFLRNFQTDYLSIVYYPIFIISLISPLFTKYRKYFLVTLIWILLVLILSIISKGYSYYTVDFRLHRSIVVVPITALAVAISISSLKLKDMLLKTIYYALFVVLFGGGIFYQYKIIYSKVNSERHRHTSFIIWLQEKMPSEDKVEGGIIMFDDNLRDVKHFSRNYTSVNDSMLYYLPNFETCSISSCPLSGYKNIYYVTANLGHNQGRRIGVFSFNNENIAVIKL